MTRSITWLRGVRLDGACVLALLCSLAMLPEARAAEPVLTAPRTTLVVRVYDGAGLAPRDVREAARVASALLAASSVEVRWRMCPEASPLGGDACRQPLAANEAVLRLVSAREQMPADTASLGSTLLDRAGRQPVMSTVFIDRVLLPLLARFPRLRLVLEHITTRHGIDFVRSQGVNVAGTLTAHHLLYNRNALFQGGIRPHYYCLPVLKRESHRLALLEAATSGDPKFFLGTDSAPHAQSAKECACGCAGIYSAHAGIELYAEAFDSAGALDRLEDFASRFGAEFYGLPRNSDTITLVKQAWTVPEHLDFSTGRLIPLRAGESVAWRLDTPA